MIFNCLVNFILNRKKSLFFIFFLYFSILNAQHLEQNLERKSFEELKKMFFQNENNIKYQKKVSDYLISNSKRDKNQSNLARSYYYKTLIKNKDLKLIYLDSIINNTNPPIEDKHFPMTAYLEKGNYLMKIGDYNESVKTYLKGEQNAFKRNKKEYVYRIKLQLAILKSEKMGEVEEALQLYKDYYEFCKSNQEFQNSFNNTEFIIFALADAYKSLNQIDSSSYYNKLGYYYTKTNKNNLYNALFTLNEGANQIKRQNYYATLDSVNKSIDVFKVNQDKANLMAAYYYKGKAYEGLNNKLKAVVYFKKVDSIFKSDNIMFPELSDGYQCLTEYYINQKKLDSSVFYLNRMKEVDSLLNINYKQITKSIHYNYDIPNVIKEKKEIIDTLENEKRAKNVILLVVLFSALLLAMLLFIQFKKNRVYKKRFDDLISSLEKENTNIEADSLLQINTSSELNISNEIIENVLKQLKLFEERKEFLEQNITLQYLATLFETNSNYLSKIVNHYKGKSFIQYINELRIDYSINELKNNPTFRKYNISAIAEEVGFNTSESFSNAFYKKTGLKPSYFIKELSN